MVGRLQRGRGDESNRRKAAGLEAATVGMAYEQYRLIAEALSSREDVALDRLHELGTRIGKIASAGQIQLRQRMSAVPDEARKQLHEPPETALISYATTFSVGVQAMELTLGSPDLSNPTAPDSLLPILEGMSEVTILKGGAAAGTTLATAVMRDRTEFLKTARSDALEAERTAKLPMAVSSARLAIAVLAMAAADGHSRRILDAAEFTALFAHRTRAARAKDLPRPLRWAARFVPPAVRRGGQGPGAKPGEHR